jgi:iron complex transport system ATP-binding protein
MSVRLAVNDATFSYDGKRNIFENITFSVKAGEVFCILGPNGTGKSTLLRCLCSLNKLNKGDISVSGTNISTLNPSSLAKKIGFIPQVHTPSFPYKVLDVVLMGRTPHLNLLASPSEKDYELAEHAIRTVGIEHLSEKPYTRLSGGEMQLVLFARVLSQAPDILLLDEPTSHLDVANQVRTIELIKQLAGSGMSVVMTSHFPDQAFLAADKVGLMKNKRFIAMGKPDEVVTETNLQETYGTEIRIVYIGGDINRKVAVPLAKTQT